MMKKWRVLIFISGSVLLLDQLTKYLINSRFSMSEKKELIPGFFDLVHYRNPGAAFGMFVGWNSTTRSVFLSLVSLFAFVFLIYYFHKTPSKEKKVLVSLSLIFGGAIGNLIDRIFRGSVIDFLLLHWRDKVTHFEWFGKSYSLELVWPAFNVADSAITIGVILLLMVNLFRKQSLPS